MSTLLAVARLRYIRTRSRGRSKIPETVRDAVESWLAHGLTGRQESTVLNRTILAHIQVVPALGAQAGEAIGLWLATKAKTLSTDTLHRLLSILRQSIRRAQAGDLVKRNVALCVTFPAGPLGVRRSRSRLRRPLIC